MARLLMPKATALWLLQHTKLAIQQISDFCGIHPLEIRTLSKKGTLQPINPLDTLQLTQEEISRCEQDTEQQLRLCTDIDQEIFNKQDKKKQDKVLDPTKEKGIAWVVSQHPSIPDADVASLLKVGKRDVKRVRTIVNSKAIKIEPENPVILKLCQKAALDRRINKAQSLSA